MRCESLGERLSAWIDGELSVFESWRIARHVASCPVCAAEAEQLRALSIQLAAANPVFEPQVHLAPRPRRSVAPQLGAGALVACGAAAFFLLPRPQQTPVAASSPLPTLTPVRVALDDGLTKFSAPESAVPPPANVMTNVMLPMRSMQQPVHNAVPRPLVGDAKIDNRMAFAAEAPTVERAQSPRRTVRRQASTGERAPERVVRRKRVGRTERVALRRRERAIALPRKPAELPASPRPRVRRAPRPAVSTAEPVRVASALPEELLLAPKLSARRAASPPAIVRAAAPAAEAAAAKPDEAPRPRVVPVLVVTPTRYENVVYVTGGAVEVAAGETEKEGEGDPPQP